jgi:zinc protease
LDDVKNFFHKHYTPCNAIMVVAGPVQTEQVKALAEKWFAGIPPGVEYKRDLPQEPEQTMARSLKVDAAVPLDALYKCWHMADRLSDGYYVADLITEIMGSGGSSRLFQKLVKEKQLFSQIECHHMGSIDPGIVVIEGKLVRGVTMEAAETAVNEEIRLLLEHGVEEKELQKAKNKTESMIAFEDMSVMSRANNLAFYELLGDANLMNTELGKYQAVTVADIEKEARKIFRDANCNTMYYHAVGNTAGLTEDTVSEEEELEEDFSS